MVWWYAKHTSPVKDSGWAHTMGNLAVGWATSSKLSISRRTQPWRGGFLYFSRKGCLIAGRPCMIFLDLEGVIIDDWFSGEPTEHLPRIKAWLGDAKEVGIFSFAIDNAEDVARFNQVFKPRIEAELGVKVVEVVTVAEVCRVMVKVRRVSLDLNDVKQLYGKGPSFTEWIFATKCPGTFVLLDDNVTNRETCQGASVVKTVNVVDI